MSEKLLTDILTELRAIRRLLERGAAAGAEPSPVPRLRPPAGVEVITRRKDNDAAMTSHPVPARDRRETCHCERCAREKAEAAGVFWQRLMYLCRICGNKRCPHATDHRLACTGSNAPGQPGSSYENAAWTPPASPVRTEE